MASPVPDAESMMSAQINQQHDQPLKYTQVIKKEEVSTSDTFQRAPLHKYLKRNKRHATQPH